MIDLMPTIPGLLEFAIIFGDVALIGIGYLVYRIWKHHKAQANGTA